MSDSRFRKGHYEDALQYTKEILSSSSSIDEIIANANIKEETKEEMEDRLNK
ncbi:hypothetical protein [Romboutsia sp.]|uniref:hypothetical protein n=1 Tax=Romboutsia sp. TaxID=1965302 RepID=UPI003F2BE792